MIEPGTYAKVRSMCGYISNDAFIAEYIGVSEAEVRRVRTNMPKGGRGISADRKPVVGEFGSPDGQMAVAARNAAAEGSRRLLEAYHRYYQKHVAEIAA